MSRIDSPTLSLHFKSVRVNMGPRKPVDNDIMRMVEILNRRQAIIKHLEMMGYEVRVDSLEEFVAISLTLDSGKKCVHHIAMDEFEQSFIVEKIVRVINDELKKEF